MSRYCWVVYLITALETSTELEITESERKQVSLLYILHSATIEKDSPTCALNYVGI